MLSELYIKNFALIDELRISFDQGLNIITGETGSGKSIMIDALSLALGKKGSKSIVRKNQKKAIIEVVFSQRSEELSHFLEKLGIEYSDDQIIITREINADGKSVSRINGRVINQSNLKQITGGLITIHGQNEYEQILSPANQLRLIDAFSGDNLKMSLGEYSDLYEEAETIKKNILRLNDNMDEASLQREISLLEYEINEIQDAKVQKGERELIRERLDKAENAEQISDNLQHVYGSIYEQENSVLNILSKSIKKIEEISHFDSSFENWVSTLNESYYGLEDMARDINQKISGRDNSADNLEELNERLDKINQIYRKYGKTYDEIMDYKDRAQARKNEVFSRDEIKEKLEKELASIEKEMKIKAQKLTEIRKKTSRELMDKLKEELKDLNMENSQLEVSFTEVPFNKMGTDQVDFLVSFNKSEEPKAFSKVASGGEISRFMLALKTVIANTDEIETLIFDEIDTGVSGVSAQKIGLKLKEISKHRQVICITHLPQIASFANTHFVVEKEQKFDATRTNIFELSKEQRIDEIAKMMSGLAVTNNTLQTAKDLLTKNS